MTTLTGKIYERGKELYYCHQLQATGISHLQNSGVLLAEYVIEDMLPLSTVESHAFRKLLNSLCSTQIPDRKSFTDHLDHQYDLVVEKVKSSLASVEHVSTTADVWTGHNRSYLGMTVHWIDPATLERRKAAISCCRVTGHHTYDVLASKIESVHANYGLLGKITATVTDNGSNFVKAFAMFQSSSDSMEMTSSLPLPPSMEDDSEEGMDRGETNFEDMNDLLGRGQNNTELTDDDMIVQYDLPPHEKCAAHTLNLVASSDVNKYLLSSTASKNVYQSSFSKCTALWNK